MSLLKGLKSVCLDQDDEKMYIANSQKIQQMIVQLFMADFYPMIDEKSEELFGKEIFTDEQKQVEKDKQIQRMDKVQSIIKKYSNHEEAQKLRVGYKKNNFLMEKVDIVQNCDDIIISAQDIVLNPF